MGRYIRYGLSAMIQDNSISDAKLVSKNFVKQTGAQIYAAANGGADDYVVTLSPVPSEYAAGMRIVFKADVANTGAATLNANGLGAVAIKKHKDRDLESGDIAADQVVDVVYDGATFQMQSQPARFTKITFAAGSDDVIKEANTQRSSIETAYTKIKEITMRRNGDGLRVSFDLGAYAGGGSTHNARIYKNGEAIGTERTTTINNGTWQTYTEDLGAFEEGDKIQLYVKTNSAPYTVQVRNFAIYAVRDAQVTLD